jgi:hypothetical protein
MGLTMNQEETKFMEVRNNKTLFSSAVKELKIRIYNTIILPVVLYDVNFGSDIKGGT